MNTVSHQSWAVRVAALAVSLLLFGGSGTRAAVFTFNNTNSGTFSWETNTMWASGAYPDAAGAMVTMTKVFAANATATVNLAGATSSKTIGGLTVGMVNANDRSYAIQTGTLIFDNGLSNATVTDISNHTWSNNTIGSNMLLNSSLDVTSTAGKTTNCLVFSGTIFTKDASQKITVGGNNGWMKVSGSSVNYNNGWTVNGGTLEVTNFGGLGSTQTSNSVVVNSGAMLMFNVNANSTFTSGKIYLNNGGMLYAANGLGSGGRVATVANIDLATAATGTIQYYSDKGQPTNSLFTPTLTIAGGGNGTLSVIPSTTANENGGRFTASAFISSGLFTKTGSGYMDVTANNAATVSGTAAISTGGLVLSQTGAIGTAKVTVAAGTVLGLNAGAFGRDNSKIGTGSVEWTTGAAERWYSSAARFTAATTDTYTVASGVNLQISGKQAVAAYDHNLTGTHELHLTGGSLEQASERMSSGYAAGSASVMLGMSIAASSTAGVLISSTNYRVVLDQDSKVGNSGVMTALNKQFFIAAPISGNSNLTKIGADPVILSGANSYTGSTIISTGVLALGLNNTLPNGTVVDIASGATLDLFNQGDATRRDLNDGSKLPVLPGNGLKPASVNVAVAGLAGNGTVRNGYWLGTSSYAYVNAGTPSLFSSTSVLTLGGTGAYNFAGTLADTITSSSSQYAVVSTTNQYAAYTATGILALTKSGLGTQTLSGSSSYSGGTLISSGTLKAGNGKAFGTGSVTLSGGVLDLRDFNIDNAINITSTGASVLLPTSSGAMSSNFAANSSFRGWQRQSGLAKNSLAQFLGGTAVGAATVTTSWSVSTDTVKFASDVIDIKGINGTTFVLQMNYADTGKGDTWENQNVKLDWYNTTSGQWVNAVLGNDNGTGTLGTHYTAAFDPATMLTLGKWGVDSQNNVVWAVVNHNSEFAGNASVTGGALAWGGLGRSPGRGQPGSFRRVDPARF